MKGAALRGMAICCTTPEGNRSLNAKCMRCALVVGVGVREDVRRDNAIRKSTEITPAGQGQARIDDYVANEVRVEITQRHER